MLFMSLFFWVPFEMVCFDLKCVYWVIKHLGTKSWMYWVVYYKTYFFILACETTFAFIIEAEIEQNKFKAC